MKYSHRITKVQNLGIRAVLLGGSIGLLLIAAGCVRNAPPTPAPYAVASQAENLPTKTMLATANADGYVGDAVCADCHRQEFQSHHDSNHAHTLRQVEPTALGKFTPPSGPVPDSEYVLKAVNNVYYLDEDPPQGYAQKMDFAFGAGRHGITLVSVGRDDTLMEMRASYFPSEKKWLATPGLEGIPPEAMGLTYNAKNSRNCFACHVTTLPANGLTPEPKFTGVGCEACHGPASAHVGLMKSGSAGTDLRINRLHSWGADKVNALCVRCHMSKPALKSSDPAIAMIPRFQPADLVLSRCFRESKNTLSCATCHNPHQNASHNERANEAICLRCHSGGAAKSSETDISGVTARHADTMQSADALSKAVTVVKGKVCPVNARAGCIPCHMPARKIMPNTQVNYMAPDHFIRVFHSSKSNKISSQQNFIQKLQRKG